MKVEVRAKQSIDNQEFQSDWGIGINLDTKNTYANKV